jgi:hypothetical protein
MSESKKLIVKYFPHSNSFYKAKLENKNQVSILSQEEATKLILGTAWTTTESKQVTDKKRVLIEKTYVFEGIS